MEKGKKITKLKITSGVFHYIETFFHVSFPDFQISSRSTLYYQKEPLVFEIHMTRSWDALHRLGLFLQKGLNFSNP